MFFSIPATARQGAAFSLVETVLALGIVSTALLSVVALVPFAVGTQRDANRIQTEARIVQAFLSEVQLCNWDQIDTTFDSAADRTRYFDDQGTPLPGAGGHVYSSRIYVTPAQLPSLTRVVMPGDGAYPTPRSEHLRQVAVHVTAIPGTLGESILDDIADPRVSRFNVNVVNLRKR